MNISKFLAKVLGIYFIVVSIAMLLNMRQFAYFVEQLINDGPLMFVSGFFTLILGILMVVSHNVWQWNWRVLISIIGWISLLKGISLIFYPRLIDAATVLFVKNISVAYFIAMLDLILGLVICYFGFKEEKSKI